VLIDWAKLTQDPTLKTQTEGPRSTPNPMSEISSLKSGSEIRIDPNRTMLDLKFMTKLLSPV